MTEIETVMSGTAEMWIAGGCLTHTGSGNVINLMAGIETEIGNATTNGTDQTMTAAEVQAMTPGEPGMPCSIPVPLPQSSR